MLCAFNCVHCPSPPSSRIYVPRAVLFDLEPGVIDFSHVTHHEASGGEKFLRAVLFDLKPGVIGATATWLRPTSYTKARHEF